MIENWWITTIYWVGYVISFFVFYRSFISDFIRPQHSDRVICIVGSLVLSFTWVIIFPLFLVYWILLPILKRLENKR